MSLNIAFLLYLACLFKRLNHACNSLPKYFLYLLFLFDGLHLNICTAKHSENLSLLGSALVYGLFKFTHWYLINFRIFTHQFKDVICIKITKILSKPFIVLRVIKLHDRQFADTFDFLVAE